jgi:two-component system cell cycle sensor histidine kinase/response regulator CckA
MDTSDVRHVLVVEDDPCNRETIQLVLEGAGHSVRATDHGNQVLAWLENGPCDLLVMDLRMPEMDGPEILRQVRKRRPGGGPRALFVSGYADLGPYADDPIVRGVSIRFKPFTLSDLHSAVQRALMPV